MALALLKLESFVSPDIAAEARETAKQDAIARAFAQGLAEGAMRTDDEQVRNLTAGLDRLAQALADDAARRALLRQEVVEALALVLFQIVDCLAPAQASARLESALVKELRGLAQQSAPVTAQITCGHGLRVMVDRCVALSGIAGIAVTDTNEARINLSLEGGRIELSPDVMAQDIRAIIDEIRKEDPSWTQ